MKRRITVTLVALGFVLGFIGYEVVAEQVAGHAIVTCSTGYTSNYSGGWVACANNHSKYRARIVCQKKTSPYWQNVHYAPYPVWSGRSYVYCPSGYAAAARPSVTWW